jgi:hypothetical protein
MLSDELTGTWSEGEWRVRIMTGDSDKSAVVITIGPEHDDDDE